MRSESGYQVGAGVVLISGDGDSKTQDIMVVQAASRVLMLHEALRQELQCLVVRICVVYVDAEME